MIRALTIATPAQILVDLKHVEAGGILKMDTWDSLFDMGLVDTIRETDGYMRDVLTEAGRKALDSAKGQAAS